MSWLNTLQKISEVAKVVAPFVPVPGVAPGAKVLDTVVDIVAAAVKDGKVDEAELAIINSLLAPHRLAVIHVPEVK